MESHGGKTIGIWCCLEDFNNYLIVLEQYLAQLEVERERHETKYDSIRLIMNFAN